MTSLADISIQPNIADDLNNGVDQRLGPAFSEILLGSLLAKLVAGTTPDDDDLTVTAGVATVTATPLAVLHVTIAAESGALAVGDVLTLKIGSAETLPASGEVVWELGTTTLRTNAGDAISAIDVWYITATDQISLLNRTLGQQD